MEDNFLSYANSAISRGSILELKVLWGKSVGLSSLGRLVRDSITSNLNEIAGINGYSQKFASFRELLLHHEDYTSPLRKMCISNDYILITRNQQIPFSPVRFFKLLKKTKLKGLRVIFDVENGSIFAREEKLSFLLRRESDKITVTEFQSEYYDDLWGPFYFIPTMKNTGVRVTEGNFDNIVELLQSLDVSSFFDEEAELTNRLGGEIRIYPGFSGESIEELVLYSLEKGEDFVVFDGVDGEGEYIFRGVDNCMNYLYGHTEGSIFDLNSLRIQNRQGMFDLQELDEGILNLDEILKDLRSKNILLSIIGHEVTSNTFFYYSEMGFENKSIIFPNIRSCCHKVVDGDLCLVTCSELETIITSEEGIEYEAIRIGIVPTEPDKLVVYRLHKLE